MNLRPAALLPLLLLAACAGAGELPVRLLSHALDANLKLEVDLPAGVPESRAAVYVFPAGLGEAGERPEQRAGGVLAWTVERKLYLDVRAPPPRPRAGRHVLLVVLEGPGGLRGRVEADLPAAGAKMQVALAIDESQSMLKTDPLRRRVDAARAFIELAGRSGRLDRIGLVGFSHEARVLLPPTTPDGDSLPRMLAAVGRVRADGMTDLDRALWEAGRLLDADPAAVVLLTDGRNEPGRYEETHRRLAERGIPVYAIGLSERADLTTLGRIAEDTGGLAFAAATDEDLMGVYQRIAARLGRRVAVLSESIDRPGFVRDLPVDRTLGRVTAAVDSAAGELGLSGPPGAAPFEITDRPGCRIARAETPSPGRWRIAFRGEPGRTLTISGESGLFLDCFPPRCDGRRLRLAVTLAQDGTPLRGATVEAHPGGTPFPLFDDGMHGDGGASDGVYGSEGPAPGPDKRFRLSARGLNLHGEPFLRQFEGLLQQKLQSLPEIVRVPARKPVVVQETRLIATDAVSVAERLAPVGAGRLDERLPCSPEPATASRPAPIRADPPRAVGSLPPPRLEPPVAAAAPTVPAPADAAASGVRRFALGLLLLALVALAALIILVRRLVRERMARFALLSLLAHAVVAVLIAHALLLSPADPFMAEPKLVARLVELKQDLGFDLAPAEEELLRRAKLEEDEDRLAAAATEAPAERAMQPPPAAAQELPAPAAPPVELLAVTAPVAREMTPARTRPEPQIASLLREAEPATPAREEDAGAEEGRAVARFAETESRSASAEAPIAKSLAAAPRVEAETAVASSSTRRREPERLGRAAPALPSPRSAPAATTPRPAPAARTAAADPERTAFAPAQTPAVVAGPAAPERLRASPAGYDAPRNQASADLRAFSPARLDRPSPVASAPAAVREEPAAAPRGARETGLRLAPAGASGSGAAERIPAGTPPAAVSAPVRYADLRQPIAPRMSPEPVRFARKADPTGKTETAVGGITVLIGDLGDGSAGRLAAECNRADPEARFVPRSFRLGTDELADCQLLLLGARTLRFSEAEIETLRRYITLGGGIWLDDAGDGRRRGEFEAALDRILGMRLSPVPARLSLSGGADAGCIELDGRLAVLYTRGASANGEGPGPAAVGRFLSGAAP